jgi:tocopherol O-methyltransferase
MSSALSSRFEPSDRSLTAEIREHYNSFAWLYRRVWGDHIHHGLFLRGDESPEEAQIQMLEHCATLAGIQPGWQVFDVGCGHGGTCMYLAGKYGCRLTGVTLSDRQCELGRENAARAGVEVDFIFADAEQMTFPAAAFDAVWTMESSEHFCDKAGYFHKVMRALRPGGVLLVSAWTGSMRSYRVRRIAEEFLCPELLTADQYSALIVESGLNIFQSKDLTREVIPTWEICRRRARAGNALLKFLPPRAKRFVAAIDTILEAYRSGDLRYTVLAARRAILA